MIFRWFQWDVFIFSGLNFNGDLIEPPSKGLDE